MYMPNRSRKAFHRVIEILCISIGALMALAIALVGAPKVNAADYDYIGLFGGLSAGHATADTNVVAGNRLVDILERTPDGMSVDWQNPETGVTYRIRVVTTVVSGNERCRTFSIRRAADDGIRESHRTACRLADGVWKINSYPATDEHGRSNDRQK